MIKIPKNPPEAGILLISTVNMLDPNFSRSVIFLCDHNSDGSFGLILNQPLPLNVSDVVNKTHNWEGQLYRGGPVQENTLHFLHRCPDLKIDSKEIMPGIFWGGDFDALNERFITANLSPLDFRFFVGYSGWGKGQLEDEIKRDSWFSRKATPDLIFFDDCQNHWRKIFATMGPEYDLLVNFPDDPRLN